MSVYLSLFLTGALAFMLMLERAHMGSWRAVVANYTGFAVGVLVFIGCAVMIMRSGGLRRTSPHSRREQAVRLVLAAVCGATGAIVAALLRGGAPHLPDAAIDGAVWGISTLVTVWLISYVFAGTRRIPPVR